MVAGVTDGPAFSGASVNGNVLTLTFNRALNEDSVPAYDSFEVRTRHNGGEGIPSCLGVCLLPVTGVSISGATVTLTLAQTIPSHGSTTVKYTRPNTSDPLIGNILGYPASPFDEQVTVLTPDTDAPLFSSARLYPYWTDCDWSRVGGRLHWRCLPTYDQKAYLWVAFNELVDEDVTPPGSAFRVTAQPPGGSARTVAVTGTVINHGNEVQMEIGPVPGGQDAKITVSYVKPSLNGLRDRAGNQMESFSGQPVTNGMPMVESVALVSDAGADRTYGFGEQVRLLVTFDTAVSVNATGGRPRLKLDLTPESGGQRWAHYEGGDETDTLTFAYTVAESDVSTAGIAVPRNPIDLNGSRIESLLVAARDRRPPLRGTGPQPGPPGGRRSAGVPERGSGLEDADADLHRGPGRGLGAVARGLPRHREQRPAQRRLRRRRRLRPDGEADPGLAGGPRRHGEGALHPALRQAAAGRHRLFCREHLPRPGGDQQHAGGTIWSATLTVHFPPGSHSGLHTCVSVQHSPFR